MSYIRTFRLEVGWKADDLALQKKYPCEVERNENRIV
jgi:hypothetical protein